MGLRPCDVALGERFLGVGGAEPSAERDLLALREARGRVGEQLGDPSKAGRGLAVADHGLSVQGLAQMSKFLYRGPMLDATPIYRGLYQGGKPPGPASLLRAGFPRLVLCAREIQPAGEELRPLRYLRVPLQDDPTTPLSDRDWRRAMGAACSVARYVAAGERVLVTCAQGRNRSGLVTAIALHVLTRWPPDECIAFIRRRRPNACTNPQFNRALLRRLR